MSAAIHFYTAVTAGKNPAEGQVVRYDSVLCEEVGAPQLLKMAIQLRDDVHVDLETAAESDLAALDLMEGVPELDWARHAHSHFSIPQCLHVGLGNTTHADPFIRYSLYRNLLPYPCVGLPPNARSSTWIRSCARYTYCAQRTSRGKTLQLHRRARRSITSSCGIRKLWAETGPRGYAKC